MPHRLELEWTVPEITKQHLRVERVLAYQYKYQIDASIILVFIGDLCIFTPDDLSGLCDETRIRTRCDFDDDTLVDDAELDIKSRRRILLDANDGELEVGFELYHERRGVEWRGDEWRSIDESRHQHQGE